MNSMKGTSLLRCSNTKFEEYGIPGVKSQKN